MVLEEEDGEDVEEFEEEALFTCLWSICLFDAV